MMSVNGSGDGFVGSGSTMSMPQRRLQPLPMALRLASEAARASTEFGAFVTALPALRRIPRGDSHPVLVLPGLGAGDASTVVLRGFLRDRGYNARAWGLGLNLGSNDLMRTDLEATLRSLASGQGRRVSLVGWSLGGAYALALGRAFPDLIRVIVTLGSPLWRPYQGRAPATSVFSRADTVVPWRRSLLAASDHTENVEVRGSHLGLGHNPAALTVIGDRLAQPEGAWAPFDPSAYGSRFPRAG